MNVKNNNQEQYHKPNVYYLDFHFEKIKQKIQNNQSKQKLINLLNDYKRKSMRSNNAIYHSRRSSLQLDQNGSTFGKIEPKKCQKQKPIRATDKTQSYQKQLNYTQKKSVPQIKCVTERKLSLHNCQNTPSFYMNNEDLMTFGQRNSIPMIDISNLRYI